jgi:hypothetical protein
MRRPLGGAAHPFPPAKGQLHDPARGAVAGPSIAVTASASLPGRSSFSHRSGRASASEPGSLADPPRRARPARSGRARRSSGDPLLAIEPAVYIEALTGRRVGRDGKVACPFHPDERPSLHAYPDPADGWTCYSARCWRGDRPNGGDIYSLAAQLWGLSPEADFPS